MDNKLPKEHIEKITKASSYFIFRNGPIKEILKDNKLSEEDIKNIQMYMENHLAYLYTVLLEENNLQKFDLIVQTMSKFYVNDNLKVALDDGGFDAFYSKLFPSKSE